MVAVPPRMRAFLTGRARARPGLFGRIVLQVEEQQEAVKREIPPPPNYDEEQRREWRNRLPEVLWSRRAWRDATWEDLQELSQLPAWTCEGGREAMNSDEIDRIVAMSVPDLLRAILMEMSLMREAMEQAASSSRSLLKAWDENGMPPTREGDK
jgi:hypothetical protein